MSGQALAAELVQVVLVAVRHARPSPAGASICRTTRLLISLSRVPSWCCWPRLCRSRVHTVVIGVGPRPCLPSDSLSSWSYHQPTASSFFDHDGQHAGRSCRAPRSSGGSPRRTAAPGCGRTAPRGTAGSWPRPRAACARTSSPMTAAGSRPTGGEHAEPAADVVRDGQDVVVRRCPSARHRSRSLPFGPVTGTITLLQHLRLRRRRTSPPRPGPPGTPPPSPACRPTC